MNETKTYSRLELEHIYAQLIFSLTDQVQTILRNNPGCDLRRFYDFGGYLSTWISDEGGPDGNSGRLLGNLSLMYCTLKGIGLKTLHLHSLLLEMSSCL